MAALGFLLPSPFFFGVSGTFLFTHTKFNQNNILTPGLPSAARETPTSGNTDGFLKSLSILLLLELRPVCLEQRMAVVASNSMIFCRNGQT